MRLFVKMRMPKRLQKSNLVAQNIMLGSDLYILFHTHMYTSTFLSLFVPEQLELTNT